MSIYCLFVGINEYQANHINNLGGCENDVNAMQDVLKERFDIPATNIVTLLDFQATREEILWQFKDHLGQAKEGDTALFYYSGHGSQEIADPCFWGIEDDHLNETLVCHDSRVTPESYDLADKELRFLIDEISKNKPRIITIIDSCHSAGATRGVDDDADSEEQVRQTPGSDTARPLDSYIFYQAAKTEGWLDDMSRLGEGAHIEMSACRDRQLSKEKFVGRTRHGVFTYYLQQTLRYTHELPSYRNLNAIVSQKVKASVAMQHPQADAIGNTDINEGFLADRIEPAQSQLFYDQGNWWINVGLAQGINQNAKLSIITDNKQKQSCDAVVIEVLHDKSRVDIKSNIQNSEALQTNQVYQALITDPAMPKLAIRLKGDQTQLEELRTSLREDHFLQETDKHAAYQIQAAPDNGSCYKLSRVSGLPVLAPIGTAREVLNQAKKMAYWERALNLAYATGELPNNCVKLLVKQQNYADTSFSRLENTDQEINLNYQWHNGDWQKPVVKFTLELNPDIQHKDNKLYVSLLFLDSLTGEVFVLANNINLIQKTQEVWDGNSKTQDNEIHRFEVKSSKNNTFRFNVDERLLKQGISRTTDFLKLVITNFDNDMSSFAQKGFSRDEYTPTCKKNQNGRSATRGMDSDEDYDYNENDVFVPRASTQTITLNTISPLKSVRSEDGTITISDSIRILPHGINANIYLQEQYDSSNKGAKGIDDTLAQPEIFKNNPYAFPLSLTAHKELDSAPTVIKIDLPETRSVDSVSISEKNPLIVEIDQKLKENEQILPFAKDGEFFIPLGYAKRKIDGNGKTHIIIEQLPDSTSAPQDTGNRSVGGSIYIYLQKIVFNTLKIEHDNSRLALPQFATAEALSVDGYEDREEILRDQIAKADKILLFVHGILGDTSIMAGSINAKLADGQTIGDNYDVVLTFDYENLNTPIAETAEALIKKLANLGLDESHHKQLDIVAHSMGGLVSRWMIEKNPAAPKVNKLVMLGTPNGGSPLSDVKKWAFGALTLALNGIALTGITGLTISLLGRLLNSADESLDEMQKDSKTLQFLYEAKDPNVPYFMIAGDTANLRIQLKESDSKFARFTHFITERSKLAVADLFTSKLFAEANDIAVSQKSMMHIPADRKHALEVTKIDCDHTSYFVNENSLKELARALRARSLSEN